MSIKTEEIVKQALLACSCGNCITCLLRLKLAVKEERLRYMQNINLRLQEQIGEFMEMAGKGDKRRTTMIDPEEFEERWDRIFGEDIRAIEVSTARAETFMAEARAQGYSEEQIEAMIEDTQ